MADQETLEQLVNEASEHEKSQRWSEAIAFYTRALFLKIKDPDPLLFLKRAICQARLTNFESAQTDVETAIFREPRNITFYIFLSEIQLKLQSFEKLLKTCDKGLKLDAQNPTLLARRLECKRNIFESRNPGCQKRKNVSSSNQNNNEEAGPAEKKRKIEPSTLIWDDEDSEDDLFGGFWGSSDEDEDEDGDDDESEDENEDEDESEDEDDDDSEDEDDDESENEEESKDEDLSPENSDFEDEYYDNPTFEVFCALEICKEQTERHSNLTNSIVYDERKVISAMEDRSARGWPSAGVFFQAYRLLGEARELLRQNRYTESFIKLREMTATWTMKFFDPTQFIQIAKMVLRKEPKNHAALFIIVRFDDQDDQEKLKLSKRLVKLDRTIGEYHALLGRYYPSSGQKKRAVNSFEKSFELGGNPDSIFMRGVTLHYYMKPKDQVVIEAYQQFLSSVPSDNMQVPVIYFILGNVYLKKDAAKAAALYRMGQVADHSSIRLPCVPNLEDDSTRVKLKLKLTDEGYWPIPKNALYSVKMCATCTKTESLFICTSCNKAWYCSNKCQENNVIIHRRFCH